MSMMQQEENPEDPPDFVISADTVVVKDEVIMEKPVDQQDNLRMLADLNGSKVNFAVLFLLRSKRMSLY